MFTKGMGFGFGLALITTGKDTLENNTGDNNADDITGVHFYNASKEDHGHH